MREAIFGTTTQDSYTVPYDRTGDRIDLQAREDADKFIRALFDAAVHGGLTKMITLTDSRVSGATNDSISTLCVEDVEMMLHVAVNGGNQNVLQYLLSCECGVQIDVRNNSGWTPLMSAINAGDARMAKLLINAGADVNLLWIENYSCLSCAVVLCAQQPENLARLGMMRLLIAGGADINAEHAITGQTPLHVAVMFASIEAMAILLKQGADLSSTDANDCTIVDFAAANGMLSVLQWLEQQGMDQGFERETSDMRTPMTRAASGGFLDVMRLLVHSQDKRWRHNQGKTATDTCLDHVNPSFVSDYLCTYRSQALYWALQSGHYDIVVFLCENGAQGSKVGAGVGYNHTTALHIAAKYGRVDLADFLIEHQGADVNYRNQRGRSPLHTAVIEGHLEIVELLLVHGAEVDAISQSRVSFMANKKADMNTPLQFAISHGHYEVAALLLHRGASVYVRPNMALEDEVKLHVAGFSSEAEGDRVLSLLQEYSTMQICS